MICPLCDLENPVEALQCDCGYAFGQQKAMPPIPPNTSHDASNDPVAWSQQGRDRAPVEVRSASSQGKTPRRFWWPEIYDAESARAAAKQGMWAALLVAGITMLLALLGSADIQLLPTFAFDLWAFVDVFLFLLVAWGIHKMSRTVAVLGLVLFVAEKAMMWASSGVKGLPVAVIMALAFINSIRGTFAFQSFAEQEAPRPESPKKQLPTAILTTVLGTVIVLGLGALAWTQLIVPHTKRSQSEAVDKDLLAIPLYQQLKIHEPAIYEVLKGRVIEAVRDGASVDAVTAASRDATVFVLKKYLPRCSDDAVIEFMHLLLRQIAALESSSPDKAFAFLFPREGESADLSAIPKTLQEMNLTVMTEILRTGAVGSPSATDAERVKALFEGVFSRIPRDSAVHILSASAPFEPGVDRAGVVRATRTLYEEILRLPKTDAALLLRSMFASPEGPESPSKSLVPSHGTSR